MRSSREPPTRAGGYHELSLQPQVQKRLCSKFNPKPAMSQQQRSHIPKFGSWDADNVPYTAYFDNARKEKGTGAVMFNPNDPEENPEAFMKLEKTTITPSSSDDFSNKQQSYKSDLKKSKEGTNNFTPPGPNTDRPKYGYNPADDIVSHRSASVPMFGAWDEKDPRSAEGFTVIFQKVKEEKHIAATNFPPIPSQSTFNPKAPNTKSHNKRLKKWCCLS